MGKKSGSASGIRDEQPISYFLELRNHFFGLKYLNSLMRIRDPGRKQFRSGIRDGKSRIPDPQHCPSLMKKAGAESGSVFVSLCYGSADPDPYQNVTDPQHCVMEFYLQTIEGHIRSNGASFSTVPSMCRFQ